MQRQVVTATAVYAILTGVAYADCGQEKCQGALRQPHSDSDGYNFVTTSRIYPKANVFVYETCVENSSDRDMDFNWFIPGPHTKVPSGFSCSNPRPMLTHKDLDTYPGCLYYGNGWTKDRGNFLPHITDQSKIDTESKDKDCKGGVVTGATNDGDTTKQARLALKSGIETDLDVLLPSDPKAPADTMTHVIAKVSLNLDPNDPNKYIHSIQLSADPFRDSKPVLNDIVIRPEREYIKLYLTNPTVKESLIKDDSITLPREVTLSTTLDIPSSPELQSVRFELSSHGLLGATLFVPYLVDGTSNGK